MMELLIAAAAQLAATAPQEWDRTCRDDRGVDRCDPEQHRRVLELFGMEPIESHREAGAEVRRAFFVSGYGSDIVAIAFSRAPGSAPVVSIHVPASDSAERPPPLQAEVPALVWEDVLDRSRLFHRELVPLVQRPQGDGDGAMTICLHSWKYTVEASDLAERPPLDVRRRVGDACEPGLAQEYALWLERVAVPLFPACAMLDLASFRNRSMLLQECAWFTGDRLAAAEVRNRLQPLIVAEKPEDSVMITHLFGQTTLDWAGVRSTPNRPADAWLRHMSEAFTTHFLLTRVHGLSANQVRVEGVIRRHGEADGEDDEAPVEQLWVKEHRDFVVRSIVVGPFVRLPPVPD